MRLGSRGLALSLVLGALAFGLDRLHKYIQIEMNGWRGGEFHQITGFFDYVLVWNTGISYGFLDGLPIATLIGIMTVAMLAILISWIFAETTLVRYSLALILGGAASHVIDRWIYGAVPDFFHFHWRDWSFYVFNISDSIITIGVCLLLLDLVLQHLNAKKQPQ